MRIAIRRPNWGTDFDKGITAYKNGDFKAALNEWVPLAEDGDAKAQAALGEMHDFGNGVKLKLSFQLA